MKKLALLVFVVIFYSTSAIAEKQPKNSYLCVADKSIGYKYNKNSNTWEIAKFNVENEEYLVSLFADGGDRTWEVKKKGKEHMYICQNINRCQSVFGLFLMNPNSLKFMDIYFRDYLSVTYEDPYTKEFYGPDTSSMTIGKCSPL
jgi:hypothetical protein